MNAEFFLESLRAQLSPSATSLRGFLTEKTTIGGRPFSFKGHEYQEFITKLIEDNPGGTFVVKKCSQIGISELFNRIVLARMALRPGEGVLISFPSKTFSQEVVKTRFADVIESSPTLSHLLDPDVDSASSKRFTNGSILYGVSGSKGGSSSLLNRPISLILTDEVDRQDPDVYSAFVSRMTHTLEIDRLTFLVSTPTIQGIGIDSEYEECRFKFVSKTKCLSCNHIFEPDFYHDLHIPDHDESFKLLTKAKASRLRIDDAYLQCPNCHERLENYVTPILPSDLLKTSELEEGQLFEEHMPTTMGESFTTIFQLEINPDGTKQRVGVALSPFTAPAFITPSSLINSSLVYTSNTEFLNQGLGKVADLKDSTINIASIHFLPTDYTVHRGLRIFGLDLGKQCHFLSGLIHYDSTIHVDTLEVIALPDLEAFLEDFIRKHPVAAGVMDSAPYSDLVYRVVKKYPCVFSAIYMDQVTPMPDLFKLTMHDKFNEVVRQLSISKNKAMDLMASSLDDFFTFAPSEHSAMLIQHLTDMRRVRDYRYEEMRYRWMKSRMGVDHMFHTLTYLFIAGKAAHAGMTKFMSGVPVQVHKFKHTENAGRRDSQHTTGYGRTNL